MVDIMIALIVLVILALAVGYIVRAKKKGQACIGCPNASSCTKHCHCSETKV
jgi:hypothetical protein